jgi:DNA-binding transcriptional ArsR family regulator
MLIDERPIMFLPKLAKALGSCERAIVLQQIHWLSRQPNSGKVIDGVHWIWGTYEEWCEKYFSMWSPVTLKHHIRKLEALGVLISAQLRAHEHDQTKFYRLNYEHELLALTGMGQHVIPSIGQDVIPSNQQHVIAPKGQDVIPSKEQHVVPSLYRTETPTKTPAEKGSAPAVDQLLSIILDELSRELASYSPAHQMLKGSSLIQVSEIVYQLRVRDAKGAEWLNQQVAGAIRKKLCVLVSKRVDLEIVSLESEEV